VRYRCIVTRWPSLSRLPWSQRPGAPADPPVRRAFTLATGPILPLDHYPGDATALQILGHGRFEAVAEPVRLYGGSALVVHPSR
jgi:gamma-glutamyltranspeptidase/glutathione hydrolase